MNHTSKRELFDQWLKKLGKGESVKYNPKILGNHVSEDFYNFLLFEMRKPFNDLIQNTLVSKEVKDQPPIYFDLLDKNYLGAYATISTIGNEFIRVNIGTILLLQDLFNRLLSHPDIFPWVGDPSKEKIDIPLIRTLYTDHELLYHYGDINYEKYKFVEPIDEI